MAGIALTNRRDGIFAGRKSLKVCLVTEFALTGTVDSFYIRRVEGVELPPENRWRRTPRPKSWIAALRFQRLSISFRVNGLSTIVREPDFTFGTDPGAGAKLRIR